jgi:BirA family transcriptional regulator, biotin operon repressor / biotin---[acetyl-CoA-carboxylase] ligase
MIGTHIIRLDTVASTNEYAAGLLNMGNVDEGTVIRAADQTAGKGQGSNTWLSEKGMNLTFTVILHPVFLLAERQFLLNQSISLAVCDFLDTLPGMPGTLLKWPNDIYSGNRKLGGILIRNTVSGNILSSCIAGIGLNINQVRFPESLPNPVSVKMITGKDTGIDEVFPMLCRMMDTRYNQLGEGKHSSITSGYLKRLIGYNAWREYSWNGRTTEGMITGVNEYGQLLLMTRDSVTHILDHGEIDYQFEV